MATLTNKVESAYRQLIEGLNLTGFAVFSGLDNVQVQAPCAVVYTTTVNEEAPQLGVFHVRVNIAVYNMAADSDATATDTNAHTIFAACLASGVAATLMGLVPELGVYQVNFDGLDETVEQDAWCRTLTLEVICVHATVS